MWGLFRSPQGNVSSARGSPSHRMGWARCRTQGLHEKQKGSPATGSCPHTSRPYLPRCCLDAHRCRWGLRQHPTHRPGVSLRDVQAAEEKPAPLGSVSLLLRLDRPGRAPPPAWPRPPHPGETQELQVLGLFTLFICFSGKVKNIGASSHIESRGVARALQRRLTARGLGWTRVGGVFHGHCPGSPQRGSLLSATRGRAEMGTQAVVQGSPCTHPPEAGAACALGTGLQSPGGGAVMGPVCPQPTREGL